MNDLTCNTCYKHIDLCTCYFEQYIDNNDYNEFEDNEIIYD
jgi:hypothetical protein